MFCSWWWWDEIPFFLGNDYSLGGVFYCFLLRIVSGVSPLCITGTAEVGDCVFCCASMVLFVVAGLVSASFMWDVWLCLSFECKKEVYINLGLCRDLYFCSLWRTIAYPNPKFGFLISSYWSWIPESKSGGVYFWVHTCFLFFISSNSKVFIVEKLQKCWDLWLLHGSIAKGRSSIWTSFSNEEEKIIINLDILYAAAR